MTRHEDTLRLEHMLEPVELRSGGPRPDDVGPARSRRWPGSDVRSRGTSTRTWGGYDVGQGHSSRRPVHNDVLGARFTRSWEDDAAGRMCSSRWRKRDVVGSAHSSRSCEPPAVGPCRTGRRRDGSNDQPERTKRRPDRSGSSSTSVLRNTNLLHQPPGETWGRSWEHGVLTWIPGSARGSSPRPWGTR